MSADPVILKILSGVQAGVEVALPDGTYAFGSGDGDDIQVIDVSLLAGHARLRLTGGRVEIAGHEGPLVLASGEALSARSEWHGLEPLDVVTAGTTRFALGPRSANWASVVDDGRRGPAEEPVAPAAAVAPSSWRVVLVPVLALLVVGLAGAWYVVGGGGGRRGASESPEQALQDVRAALDAFPFGRTIEARQEVDGAIYVTGYVETPVERRALAGALDKTGVPAHPRLWVRQDMRRELGDVIASQKVDARFTLSDAGDVTLDGLILDEAESRKLTALVSDRVLGVHSVASHIVTAESLLAEVRKLVAASGLQPWLLLRLDGQVIEVSGALPSDKIDNWVGFLQTYANRYAKEIALRSFVQLQTPGLKPDSAPSAPLALGGPGAGAGGASLDLEKLRNGSFSLDDIFVGPHGPGGHRDPAGSTDVSGGAGAAGPRGASDTASGAVAPPGDKPAPVDAGSAAATPSRAATAAGSGMDATGSGAAAPPEQAAATGQGKSLQAAGVDASGGGIAAGLQKRAADALLRLRRGRPARGEAEADLSDALSRLSSEQNGGSAGSGGGAVAEWFLPLLGRDGGAPKAAEPCWTGTSLTPAELLPALFWLDVLSTGRSLSIQDFDRDQRLLLLEVALDPDEVRACSRRAPAAAKAADHSLYLREVSRNPGFVGYVTRSLPTADLDVAGASVGRRRFVITRNGTRLFEGAAPDRGSRVALVGELGAVVQRDSGLAVSLFGPDVTWRVTN